MTPCGFRTFTDRHILGETALQNEFTIFAQEVCREAGKILLDFYGKLNNENIAQKNKHDFVTDADKASEKFIVAKIEQRYPRHGIHGEEFTSKEAQCEYTWFIDPLDGTTNFVHGHPFFAISMGLRCADELICGVVYSPILNEMFYAALGEGAYLNGRRIYTSSTTTLENSLLATGFPYKKAEIERNNLGNFNCLLPQVRGVRRCGAAAIDMCYVGCGRYDGFWELWLQPHDVAAGTVIVREAGGIVTDFAGGEGYLFAGNVLATNKHIYSSLQKNVVF